MEHKVVREAQPGTAMLDIVVLVAVSAAAFTVELWARTAGPS